MNNEEFNHDLARARAGISNEEVQKRVDKWGARGGAFYAFFTWRSYDHRL